MKIKKYRFNQSLFRIFFFHYLYALIILLISMGIFILISMYCIESYLSLTDTERMLIEENFFVENYKDINTEVITRVGGWIEKIQDNKVVEVIGEKKDDIQDYSIINIINQYDEMVREDNVKYDSRAYKNNDNSMVYIVKVPNGSFLLTEKLYEKSIGTRFYEIIIFSLCIAIIFMILAMYGLFYKSIKSVSVPLRKIQRGINSMTSGDYNVRLNFNTYKEVDIIKDSFNFMVKKLQEAENSKKEVEKSKKSMIRDIAHDIKTPITSIMGYSKALVDGRVEDKEEQKVYLEYIYNKTLRLNYLINELFLFTKIDSLEYKIILKREEIGDFIREIAALYYGEMEENGFDLVLDIEEPIYCNIAAKELERAIGNLIINSLKYNDAGTTLSISLKEEEKEIIIIVSDNGKGMKESLRENIFYEFVRGDISRNSSGGSGLGLAITKKIVEMHKGKIELKSEINKGSTFTIKLPK
ncbi:HAMP domain-containing sensor histidine kinase [Clostridium carnis]